MQNGSMIGCLALLAITGTPSISQTHFTLDSICRFDYLSGDTVPSLKTIFTYDAAGKEIEKTEQSWSLAGRQWEFQTRITQSYQGSLPDTITNWVFAGQHWQPSMRTVHLYTPGAELEETVAQEWDDGPGEWVNRTQTRQGGLQTGFPYRLRSMWDSSLMNWVIVDSTVSVHHESDRVRSDTTYQWFGFARIYLYSTLVEYRYDSLQNLVSQTRYRYDLSSLEFLPRSRDTFAYDQKHFQILSRFDTWDRQTQSWVPSLSIDRTPNDDGYLSESRISFHDFISNELVPTSRLEYTYTDGSGRGLADSLILSVKNFTYAGTIEVPDWKTHYYYSMVNLTSSRDLIHVESLLIYPNPASAVVFVQDELTNVRYFRWISAEGKMLSTGELSGKRIQIPGVNGTQYVYLLLSDEQGKPLQMVKILVNGQ
jgi:hypothetical protein